MLGQDPAGLRELVRIAEDHPGVAQRLLSRHSQHRDHAQTQGMRER